MTGKLTGAEGTKPLSAQAPAECLEKLGTGTVTSAAIGESSSKAYPKEDPPDVNQLGRASWTLLHSVAAKYPNSPSDTQKQEMKQFMTIFSHVYPCGWCAKDFEKFIKHNSPKVDSKEDLGRWICTAHNEVNEKLGKEKFDCDLWKKRWVDGWD